MVNEDNIPKTETVYELKNEIPSFEEFIKTYETDEANKFLTEAEYQDQVLHGPRYGPGNSNSNEYGAPPRNTPDYQDWLRFGEGSFRNRSSSSSFPFLIPRPRLDAGNTGFIIETYLKASATTIITTATGGLAPVVGGAMWIGGELLQSTNESFLNFVGSKVKSIGGGTFFGGVFSNSVIGEVAKNNGISLKDLEWFYEAKGSAETVLALGKHAKHKDDGISYDSNCEVCKRNS